MHFEHSISSSTPLPLPGDPAFWNLSSPHQDCWFWTGYIRPDGYGQYKRGTLAHRHAWELVNGPIPDGLCLLHSCDVNYIPGDLSYRQCIRPNHLHLGTRVQNQAEMVAKHRSSAGSHRWNAKLTEDKVKQIRQMIVSGMTLRAIAKCFGVDFSIISEIKSGKRWTHVL